MIERQYGKVILVCDECGDNSEEFDDFGKMMREAKMLGWAIIKDDNDEWTHACPSCSR